MSAARVRQQIIRIYIFEFSSQEISGVSMPEQAATQRVAVLHFMYGKKP
jgi:hypothetical protein